MYEKLEQLIKTHQIHVLREESLSRHSTWCIGGPADYVLFPSRLEHISILLRFAHTYGLSWIVIGRGSNLLFSDQGFHGMILKLDRPFSRVSIQGETINAESGVSVPRLAHQTALAGLTGLEHAVGIPGTLGALVVINGGSLRHTIGESVTEVCVVGPQGEIQTLSPDDCDFAYRHSRFLLADSVVAKVTLRLKPGRTHTIRKDMLEILKDRRQKYPLNLPNCGSVFKSYSQLYNTLGPPGKIIEDLGLKGLACGDARVSHQHANFFVNQGKATAGDVLSLIQRVQNAIHQKHGLWLDTEAIYVHSNGKMEPASQAVKTCPHLVTSQIKEVTGSSREARSRSYSVE